MGLMTRVPQVEGPNSQLLESDELRLRDGVGRKITYLGGAILSLRARV